MYPRVGSSFLIILQGFPITIENAGISIFTYELGAIKTLSPIFMLPTITDPVPIHTLLLIVGYPFRSPLLACPIVTFLKNFINKPHRAISFRV